MSKYTYTRKNKGDSLIAFPSSFTVIDLETTGLSTACDDIIELAAIKVSEGEVVETFQSFVNTGYELPEFIIELTGITNDMIKDAPSIEGILPSFIDFLEDSILVGHNINFDINFLYDNIENINGNTVSNDFVDTLRLCRRLYKELEHHRLIDMVEYLNITPDKMHRSLSDCYTCLDVFNACQKEAIEQFGSEEEFVLSTKKKKRNNQNRSDINSILPQNDDIDISNPLYKKVCVFTGTLEKMKRADAMQIVFNLGGVLGKSVTKQTNYLILGNNDYCPLIKEGKSNKQKKAESYKLKGFDIEIIPEQTFYEMIEI